jgi:CRP-like cAMP-binding protein
METGDTFGEMALIRNKPRLATIKSTTFCIFATLTKENFNKVFSTIIEQIKIKTDYLLKIFPTIPLNYLIRLAYDFKEKILIKN